jgi:hypothetical protein
MAENEPNTEVKESNSKAKKRKDAPALEITCQRDATLNSRRFVAGTSYRVVDGRAPKDGEVSKAELVTLQSHGAF